MKQNYNLFTDVRSDISKNIDKLKTNREVKNVLNKFGSKTEVNGEFVNKVMDGLTNKDANIEAWAFLNNLVPGCPKISSKTAEALLGKDAFDSLNKFGNTNPEFMKILAKSAIKGRLKDSTINLDRITNFINEAQKNNLPDSIMLQNLYEELLGSGIDSTNISKKLTNIVSDVVKKNKPKIVNAEFDEGDFFHKAKVAGSSFLNEQEKPSKVEIVNQVSSGNTVKAEDVKAAVDMVVETTGVTPQEVKEAIQGNVAEVKDMAKDLTKEVKEVVKNTTIPESIVPPAVLANVQNQQPIPTPSVTSVPTTNTTPVPILPPKVDLPAEQKGWFKKYWELVCGKDESEWYKSEHGGWKRAAAIGIPIAAMATAITAAVMHNRKKKKRREMEEEQNMNGEYSDGTYNSQNNYSNNCDSLRRLMGDKYIPN